MNFDNQGGSITPEMKAQLDREATMAEKGRVRAEKRRKRLEKRGGLSSTKAAKLQQTEEHQSVMGAVMAFVVEAGHSNKNQWIEPVMAVDPDLIAVTALKICQDSAAQCLTSQNTFHRAGMAMQATHRHAYMTATRAGKRLYNEMKKIVFPSVDNLKWMGKFEQGEKGSDDHLEWELTQAERTMQKANEKFEQWEVAFDEWDRDKYKAVGSFLIAAVLRGCDLFEEKMLYVEKQGKPSPQKVGHIVMTEKAKKQLANGDGFLDGLFPMFTPIIGVPPQDWDANTFDRGGPYHDPAVGKLVPLIKHATPEQNADAKTRIGSGDMQYCLDAINTLQKTPLTINRYVLDCIDWAVDSGKHKELADFPEIIAPEPWEDYTTEVFETFTPSEKAQAYRERLRVGQEIQEVEANQLNLENHCTQAEELLDCADKGLDKFWLPHQFDFRGRVYCTPDFNFQKNDYIRALFQFYNKTAITPENDEFLWLQLANTWGNRIDKLSYDKRFEWVGDNAENILKTGQDFRTTFDFWKEADDPFQFVAACREDWLYTQAQAKGEVHLSGLPVALDATNSGYQHYAAASLNEHDGHWTNLVDPEGLEEIEPRDLYLVCRDAALKQIPIDISVFERELETGIRLQLDEDGEEVEEQLDETDLFKVERKKQIAEVLLSLDHNDGGDGLTRKVAKGPVMTWAYSSEEYGIAKALRKSYFDKFTKQVLDKDHPRTVHPYGDDTGFAASFYVADLLVRSIRKSVKSAEVGMSFFQDCSDALQSENKHFSWITKTGFPAYQCYQKHEKNPSKVRLFWWNGYGEKAPEKRGATRVYKDEVRGIKSRNAISPNIIHAMDATHLMSTVLGCAEQGLTDLMVVHDSFATTIGNAALLRNVLRQEFYDQYAEYSLYADIRRQVAAKLASTPLPELPEDGTLDLARIKKAKYPFS